MGEGLWCLIWKQGVLTLLQMKMAFCVGLGALRHMHAAACLSGYSELLLGLHSLMTSSARRQGEATAQESSGFAAEGEAGAPAGPAGIVTLDGDDGEGPGIAAEADAGEPAARRTAVVEQCCAWGGEQRLRLRLTLSVGPGARGLTGEAGRLPKACVGIMIR